MDKNGDGYLQKEEILHILKEIKKQKVDEIGGTSPSEIWEAFLGDDTDGDGQIDLEEFIQMFKQGEGDVNKTRMALIAKNVLADHKKKLDNNVVGSDTWMISPLNPTHAMWDILVSLLITITLITMPLSLGWEEMNDDFFEINLVFDFIFMLDVIKNFNTGIVDENDAIIMDAKKVRKSYLTGFFLSDLCSSIPLDLILKLVSAGVVVS